MKINAEETSYNNTIFFKAATEGVFHYLKNIEKTLPNDDSDYDQWMSLCEQNYKEWQAIWPQLCS